MQNTFSFTADFLRVFRACGADDFCIFVDAPVHTSYAPSPLDVLETVVDYACKGRLNRKFANGVDDGGKDHAGCKVCGWEDADGDFVAGRLEGALYSERALNCEDVGECGKGFTVEYVVYVTEAAV